MDAADGSGGSCEVRKKRRREIYAKEKESQNSRRRELYAEARELRDARLQEVDAQRRATALTHNRRLRRKRIVEEALPLNSTTPDASAEFSYNASEMEHVRHLGLEDQGHTDNILDQNSF